MRSALTAAILIASVGGFVASSYAQIVEKPLYSPQAVTKSTAVAPSDATTSAFAAGTLTAPQLGDLCGPDCGQAPSSLASGNAGVVSGEHSNATSSQ